MHTRALAIVVVLATAVTEVSAQRRGESGGPETRPAEAGGPDTFRVVGRVLGPEGRPLAGATVLADNGGSYQVMKEWTETPWRNWVPDPIAAASIGPFMRRAKA